MKKTPLFEQHKELGGKLVEFAGWSLPVQYSGVIPEHRAVREAAGIFDVSHMGELLVSGREALQALQFMTCNDLSLLYPGKAQYTAITNESGGVVDDIIVYMMSPERFFLCVNASNSDKVFAWFCTRNKFDAEFKNVSLDFGQIALQGPKAVDVIRICVSNPVAATELKPFHFIENEISGCPIIIARTGYTGEDGFELFVPWDRTEIVWRLLLELGASCGVVPCGLGARDSLRLEACYPLHGHELAEDISAIESGLGWIVKLSKGEFIGSKVLAEQKAHGAPRALVGLIVEDNGIIRSGDVVFSVDGTKVGYVTSGTKTPTINKAIALALIDSSKREIGTKLLVEVRGRRLAAVITKTPFYKRSVLK